MPIKVNTLKQLVGTAKILKALREKKEMLYEAYRATAEPIETAIEESNLAILDGFKNIGVNNIKLDSGESYTRSVKRGLEVVEDTFALKWAIENMAISIDKRIVAQKLKESTEAPRGFRFIEREEVRITLPKAKEDKKE